MLKRQTSSSLVLEDLQKSNEELRKKLSDSLLKDSSLSLESSSIVIQKLCEKESEELRRTVSRLERLLALEREERNANEEKAIELLTDVKRQWQEREEIRIQRMRTEVESAHSHSHEVARRNAKLLSELERSTSELENALDLKNKLKEKTSPFKYKNMNLISLHLSPKMNLFKGILSIQKKDVSQKEQQLLSEKMDILMEIKSKDQEINSLKERLYSLESQVEKSKIKIREQSSKLNVALADLKEANIQLNELKESGLDKDAKLDSLHKEIEDLEEKMRAQSVKYEEELQVFEANRKKDEKKELEKYNELQGEIERLMMDKQDASFCVDESERKAKSLETEVKKIKLENDELSERYKRKEMELESKISILKEDSNKVIYNKESIILEIQDDLRRIQSQKDALEREKTTMERSLYKKEEVQKSQMREIESLKLKVERQKEEINAKPPCSPVKVINNIVVDKTSELEDEKKALSYEKKMFEAEKREIISQKEEMKKIKLS
ncbi:uncharacterized protein [Lepeophtheirus salmonis]|uniref:uncharacterized protein n=1 Tax=Lepeophtheirus salmonis TaxID=72036 RepID=UPI003AF3DEEC